MVTGSCDPLGPALLLPLVHAVATTATNVTPIVHARIVQPLSVPVRLPDRSFAAYVVTLRPSVVRRLERTAARALLRARTPPRRSTRRPRQVPTPRSSGGTG